MKCWEMRQLRHIFKALLPLCKEETMDKNQVIEILSSKGFFAHDTNGILYVDLNDIGPSSINKIRNMLTELGYHNSWGVKMVKAGSLPLISKEPDLSQDYDYSEMEVTPEKESKIDPVYEIKSDSVKEMEAFDNAPINYNSHEEPQSLDDEKIVEDKHEDEESDDMMFDENSPFEQVSLFDMMS